VLGLTLRYICFLFTVRLGTQKTTYTRDNKLCIGGLGLRVNPDTLPIHVSSTPVNNHARLTSLFFTFCLYSPSGHAKDDLHARQQTMHKMCTCPSSTLTLPLHGNKKTKPQLWRTRKQDSTQVNRLPHRGACWAECVRSAPSGTPRTASGFRVNLNPSKPPRPPVAFSYPFFVYSPPGHAKDDLHARQLKQGNLLIPLRVGRRIRQLEGAP